MTSNACTQRSVSKILSRIAYKPLPVTAPVVIHLILTRYSLPRHARHSVLFLHRRAPPYAKSRITASRKSHGRRDTHIHKSRPRPPTPKPRMEKPLDDVRQILTNHHLPTAVRVYEAIQAIERAIDDEIPFWKVRRWQHKDRFQDTSWCFACLFFLLAYFCHP